jgi:hypothetical protein
MKKILSLYLSMLLIYPIGAQAASVPSIIGALSWTMESLPSFTVFTQMHCFTTIVEPAVQGFPPFTPNLPAITMEQCIPIPNYSPAIITAINASVTDPKNGLPHYSLTGTASLLGATSPIPISGVMSTSGAGYILQFNFPIGNVTCTIAQSSLSGACYSNANPAVISKFTLVTP